MTQEFIEFLQLFSLNSNNVGLWFPAKELNLMLGMFSNCRSATGGRVCRPRNPGPRDLGAATFGGKTITSEKELRGFPFDVVRGYCMLPCGRMLRARWSVCACAAMHVM